MNILDLIILALVAGLMLLGYHRGLIMTLFRLTSFFISIILTRQFYPPVSKMLINSPIYHRIEDYVMTHINLDALVPDTGAFNLNHIIDVNGIENNIGTQVSVVAVDVIAMVAVYLLVCVLIHLVARVLNLVGKLPVIKTFNRLGGLVAGLAEGGVITWVGLAIAHLFLFVPRVAEWLTGSLITRIFFPAGS